MIFFSAPIRVDTKDTQNGRLHHMARYSRGKEQVEILMAYWIQAIKAAGPLNYPEPPVLVSLTRIAPKALDGHDNLRASLKATVDGIAKLLKVDDGDPGVRWEYAQRRGKPHQYAVEVSIQPLPRNLRETVRP